MPTIQRVDVVNNTDEAIELDPNEGLCAETTQVGHRLFIDAVRDEDVNDE
jgi:hypothetical protein